MLVREWKEDEGEEFDEEMEVLWEYYGEGSD